MTSADAYVDTSIAYERQIEVAASLHAFSQSDDAINQRDFGRAEMWSETRQFA
jgi:hypothetical protein